jgi:urease accessory protein
VIDATTSVTVGLDCRGHTVVQRMYCEVPLLVRVVGVPGPTLSLAMVNGAAGPLGGDRLRFRLEVGRGARLAVCSVAASIVQPGPRGESSELHVDLVVGDDAVLDWHPEPAISVAGSNHRVVVRLTATNSSRVAMREGVSLGRSGEPPGCFALRERVVLGGVAVLDHETVFAPGGLMGPGAQGNGLGLTTEVLIGETLPPPSVHITDHSLRSTVRLSSRCALVTTRTVRDRPSTGLCQPL